jgi:N-acetylneuraminate synthase
MNFNKQISILDKKISNKSDVYFIAEIGANFDGDLKRAKDLCLLAKQSGADCAKFQSFKSERLVSDKGFSKMDIKGVHGTWNKSIGDTFKEVEFPRAWHGEVKKYCESIDIHFSTSPYDFEAVDLCVELDLPFIKIGSGDITYLEIIEKIAKTQKPIFLATGDASMAEIDEAIRVIQSTGNQNLVLMQCITNYPSMIESANINVLKTYESAFNLLTGYSDHSPGDLVILGAVSLGATVVEKHFTDNKSLNGPDHPHSMTPVEFKQMVEKTKLLKQALGSSSKFVVEEERETVIVQRRGLYASQDIAKDELFSSNNIEELRPALGILPKYKNKIIGRRASNDIFKGEPIYWDSL